MKKNKITIYSTEERLKAAALLDDLSPNCKTFIVRHIIENHLEEFLENCKYQDKEIKI